MSSATPMRGLRLRTVVTYEVVQDGSTADMIFPVGAILAYFSEVMTLNPGDIIATGTPDGVGFRRTPPRHLHPGDRVRVEIDKVGAVANPIIDRAGPGPVVVVAGPDASPATGRARDVRSSAWTATPAGAGP